jgi:hypothetical protein
VTFAVTGGGGTVIDGTQLSAADGTATVGGWILGSVGVNTLAAAVTGGADPAVFTATGDELLFQPPNDTSLAGTVSVTRFIIPAGRTVTATGPLVIDSDSTVSIDGTLRGDCVSILIKGRETVTISGALDNSCIAESLNPPNLRIVAAVGYSFENADLTSSGDIIVTNDSTIVAAAALTTEMRGAGSSTSAQPTRGNTPPHPSRTAALFRAAGISASASVETAGLGPESAPQPAALGELFQPRRVEELMGLTARLERVGDPSLRHVVATLPSQASPHVHNTAVTAVQGLTRGT